MPGPNPEPRANGIVGQGVRILDHRGLYRALAGTEGPPQRAPRAMFAAFPLDLALVPNPQVFMLPIQQPKLVQVLAERAGQYGANIRCGHTLTGYDQDDDGVTVRVSGPDGDNEVRAKYLVGADGGTSTTRKLASIEFPGMTSDDVVARMGFDVLPPAEWIDAGSGALDVPGATAKCADDGCYSLTMTRATASRSAPGVHPAVHPPRLSAAAGRPVRVPHGEQPPPFAARSRWFRCHAACAELFVEDSSTASGPPAWDAVRKLSARRLCASSHDTVARASTVTGRAPRNASAMSPLLRQPGV